MLTVIVTNRTTNPLPLGLLLVTESETDVLQPLPDARVLLPGAALTVLLLPEQRLMLSWPLSRGVLSNQSTHMQWGSLWVDVVPASYASEATATFAAALTTQITGSSSSPKGSPQAGSFAILQGVTQLGPISVCNATIYYLP